MALPMSPASTTAIDLFIFIVEFIVAALNSQGPSLYQQLRHFFSGVAVYPLHRGPGHIHSLGTFLLGQTFIIYEANGLILLQCHGYFSVYIRIAYRSKKRALRYTTYLPPFSRPCHFLFTPFSHKTTGASPCRLFLSIDFPVLR